MIDKKQNPQTLPAENASSGRADNGRWLPGCPGGPGRPKKARIKDAIDGQYADKPTELMYKKVAESLDVERHEVPVFEEVQQLQVWAFILRGLSGSPDHARELLDRTDPKPSRSQIEIKHSRTPASAGGVGDEEADNYYSKLTGDDDE